MESTAAQGDASLTWTLGPGRPGLVSVIVPAYNRADLIVDTLDSVYRQTYRPIELILVDDGSRDSTVEVAETWAARLAADDRFVLRVVCQENAGASVARNHGVQECQGELIQFLDSDDVLDRDKIALQALILKQDDGYDFAYGPVANLENPTHLVYCQSAMSQRRMILKHLVVPTLQTMSPLSRRTMVERVGRWNPLLPPCDDWEYYSRAVVLGCRGAYVADARSYYRAHPGERLSKHSGLDRVVRGRFGQIESMLEHAPDILRDDPEFTAVAAWQLLITTARFVVMGWQGDEAARYRQAIEVAESGLVCHAASAVLASSSVFGRRGTARLFLIFPWVFYRLTGFKARLKRRSAQFWERALFRSN